jgi:hypothetical protein
MDRIASTANPLIANFRMETSSFGLWRRCFMRNLWLQISEDAVVMQWLLLHGSAKKSTQPMQIQLDRRMPRAAHPWGDDGVIRVKTVGAKGVCRGEVDRSTKSIDFA